MSIAIRPAKVTEAAEILALQQLCYQSEAELYNDYSIPPLQQTLEELQAEFTSYCILAATIDGKIIGSVRGCRDGDTCFVGRLIVHPDYQRRGIGSNLLCAIEDAVSATSYELFTGHKSEGNLKLYRGLGYIETRRKQVSPNLELVFLSKKKL